MKRTREPTRQSSRIKDQNIGYATDKRRRTSIGIDDSEGHLIIKPKTILNSRYVLLGILGQGTFGTVVQAYDSIQKTEVAIKIIKSIQKYTDASKIEIRILNCLKQNDPKNENQCIHLLDQFVYRNHVCMVFELLGFYLLIRPKSV